MQPVGCHRPLAALAFLASHSLFVSHTAAGASPTPILIDVNTGGGRFEGHDRPDFPRQLRMSRATSPPEANRRRHNHRWV